MELTPQQKEQLLQQLQNDYQFRDRKGNYLTHGICPSCKKRQLFISKSQPWQMACNRRNHCAYSASTYEIYKDTLFADWQSAFKQAHQNSETSADGYMLFRGFQMDKILGVYTQGEYFDPKSQISSKTVRFKLQNGSSWERIIHAKLKPKGRALGSYKHSWWQLPNADFSKISEIWITEGIFDALSLVHAGKHAIASISCSHYPQGFFDFLRERSLSPRIVFALDNDTAGIGATEKHFERAKAEGFDVCAAFPPEGQDWNDLWKSACLNQKTMEEALHRGRLHFAKSPFSKGICLYCHEANPEFSFIFQDKTYWFSLNLQRYEKQLDHLSDLDEDSRKQQALLHSAQVHEIMNCRITPLFFKAAHIGEDAQYFVQINRPNKPKVRTTFSGAQLSSVAEFKKRLLSTFPGALFSGSALQLDYLIKNAGFGEIKIVESIDFTGYLEEADAWVFNDFAVCQGKVIPCNDEGFIEVSPEYSVKSSSDVAIHCNTEAVDFGCWKHHFWEAFLEKGLIALAFFVGSLFVNQIRKAQKSFPFLEISGDAATGKTTLIEFLWRLLGRADYEGFDPGKTSFAGRARTFNKVSGLPVVLIESDRGTSNNARHLKHFDFSEIKDLFNGRSMYVRGVASAGLETYDPPFRGSVVIAQNRRVHGDEAILSRIVPLVFNRKNLSPLGKMHVQSLNLLSAEALSSFLCHVLCHSKQILNDYFRDYPRYEALFSREISLPRMAQNGAQIMTMVNLMARLLRFSDAQVQQTAHYLLQACIEQQTSMMQDSSEVYDFWESYHYLESLGGRSRVNHSSDRAFIALNLPYFEARAKAAEIQILPRMELNHLLQQSRLYPFVERKIIWSALEGKSIKCMIFHVLNKGEHSEQ